MKCSSARAVGVYEYSKEIVKSLSNKSTSDTAIIALKYVSTSLSGTLSAIINASFSQGVFPEELKLAKVIPIHKSGKKTDVSNYRPISLLSAFSLKYSKRSCKSGFTIFSRIMEQYISTNTGFENNTRANMPF